MERRVQLEPQTRVAARGVRALEHRARRLERAAQLRHLLVQHVQVLFAQSMGGTRLEQLALALSELLAQRRVRMQKGQLLLRGGDGARHDGLIGERRVRAHHRRHLGRAQAARTRERGGERARGAHYGASTRSRLAG